MSYAPSHPDLERFMMTARDQLLAFCYGSTEEGELLTTGLPEAAPLLVLYRSGDAHNRLVLAWIAQISSKCAVSRLRVGLIEQAQDQKLTWLLQDYPQTAFIARSAQGLIEAIWCHEGTLLQREGAAAMTPPWLIVLEISEAIGQDARVWQGLHALLARGQGIGLFFLVLAPRSGQVVASLPDAFATTLVLDDSSTLRAGEIATPSPPRATLYRATTPSPPVSNLGRPIDPVSIRALLDRETPREQMAVPI